MCCRWTGPKAPSSLSIASPDSMMAVATSTYAVRKGNQYYAVIYEGRDPITGSIGLPVVVTSLGYIRAAVWRFHLDRDHVDAD